MDPNPREVVIAMGINDANSNAPILPDLAETIQNTVDLAKEKFPEARILLAEINCSDQPRLAMIKRAMAINRLINCTQGVSTLNALPTDQIETVDTPGIHWTGETANSILDNWTSQLKN